jgi:hypothetical protein
MRSARFGDLPRWQPHTRPASFPLWISATHTYATEWSLKSEQLQVFPESQISGSETACALLHTKNHWQKPNEQRTQVPGFAYKFINSFSHHAEQLHIFVKVIVYSGDIKSRNNEVNLSIFHKMHGMSPSLLALQTCVLQTLPWPHMSIEWKEIDKLKR